jgi:hypothetical protein
VLKIERKAMNVLAAVGGAPIAKAQSDIVEKPIACVRDRLHWPAHDNDHVEEEERMVFVGRLSCSTAGFAASVVHGVPLLHHLDGSCAVELRILQLGQKILC